MERSLGKEIMLTPLAIPASPIEFPADISVPRTPRPDFKSESREAIHAWANLSKPVMRGNAGKFRELLTPNDVRYVELRCFDLMKVFDYKPEQVTKKPEPREFDRAIAFLQPLINAGTYIIRDENEQETRKRRLAALDGVLKRRL